MLALSLLSLCLAQADPVAEARSLARIGLSLQAIEVLEAASRTMPTAPLYAYLSELQAGTNRLPQAAESLSRALEMDPRQHRWRMTLGILYVQLGRMEEARPVLERVVRDWPESALAYYYLAAVLKVHGELERAEEQAKEAVERLPTSSVSFRLDRLDHPPPVNALFLLAEIRCLQGSDAEPLLRRVLEVEPFHAPARYLLARGLLRRGKSESAKEELERFRQIKRTESLYRNALLLMVNWGKEEEALADLRAAVEASPDHPAALFLLGRELYRRGRQEEASSYLERSAELRPQAAFDEARRVAGSGELPIAIEILDEAARTAPTAASYAYLSELQARVGRLPQAARSLTRALEMDPGQVRWRATLGSLLFQLGRLQEAQVELERVVDEWPEGGLASYYLAAALKARGELARAERLSERAVELLPVESARSTLDQLDHPAPINALFLLAEIRQMQGMESEALLRRLLEVEPLHAQGHYLLARLDLERGRRDRATEELELFRRIKETEEHYRNAIGYLFNMGDERRALEEMHAAVEATPDHPAALFLLGKQLLRLGKVEEAARYLERCARLSPRTASEVEPFLVLVELLRRRAQEGELKSDSWRASLGSSGGCGPRPHPAG